jgi:hypothetical protein
VEYIREQRDTFSMLNEQEKIAFIQHYLEHMME